MAEYTHIDPALQAQIDAVQAQLNKCDAEAIRLQRELEMAERAGEQDNTQLGRLEAVEEEVAALRQQLSELHQQASQQSAEPPKSEPVAVSSQLGVGAIAWVAQEGGISTRLHTRPGLNPGGVIDRLAPGTQMTVLDGPEDVDGHTWWRVRSTEGREGWVADDGLLAH